MFLDGFNLGRVVAVLVDSFSVTFLHPFSVVFLDVFVNVAIVQYVLSSLTSHVPCTSTQAHD
jgi:hypothetical protein